MEKYYDKVRVICFVCNKEHDNEMYYGENDKYPDDFLIKCKQCGNTEEGTPPLQGFKLIKDYGRIEIK